MSDSSAHSGRYATVVVDPPWEQYEGALDMIRDLELMVGSVGAATGKEYDELKEQFEVYREFFEAWEGVEKGTIDFGLHAEQGERLRVAHEAVWTLSNPASAPGIAATPTQSGASAEGNDAEAGAGESSPAKRPE